MKLCVGFFVDLGRGHLGGVSNSPEGNGKETTSSFDENSATNKLTDNNPTTGNLTRNILMCVLKLKPN